MLLHAVREIAQERLGIDVARWPRCHPLWPISKLLAAADIDLVLDVGASNGRYVRELRRLGYRRRAFSFEPLPGPNGHDALREAARADPAWDASPFALGDDNGPVQLHIAGNAGASSSILPMLRRHEEAAPESQYTATVVVDQRRLDTMWEDVTSGRTTRPFLKIDVQGYEQKVLEGASGVVDELVGLQMEASLMPLYADAWLWTDALDWIDQAGLTLVQLLPGFTDQRTGRLLQVDVVAMRERVA